jgi:hypothetical protein
MNKEWSKLLLSNIARRPPSLPMAPLSLTLHDWTHATLHHSAVYLVRCSHFYFTLCPCFLRTWAPSNEFSAAYYASCKLRVWADQELQCLSSPSEYRDQLLLPLVLCIYRPVVWLQMPSLSLLLFKRSRTVVTVHRFPAGAKVFPPVQNFHKDCAAQQASIQWAHCVNTVSKKPILTDFHWIKKPGTQLAANLNSVYLSAFCRDGTGLSNASCHIKLCLRIFNIRLY